MFEDKDDANSEEGGRTSMTNYLSKLRPGVHEYMLNEEKNEESENEFSDKEEYSKTIHSTLKDNYEKFRLGIMDEINAADKESRLIGNVS